jgi:hypothetical protein
MKKIATTDYIDHIDHIFVSRADAIDDMTVGTHENWIATVITAR